MRLIEVKKDELAERRIKSGFSLKKLAEKAGVHYATLNRLEDGKTNVNPDTAVKVCTALSVNFDDIFVIREA